MTMSMIILFALDQVISILRSYYLVHRSPSYRRLFLLFNDIYFFTIAPNLPNLKIPS